MNHSWSDVSNEIHGFQTYAFQTATHEWLVQISKFVDCFDTLTGKYSTGGDISSAILNEIIWVPFSNMV